MRKGRKWAKKVWLHIKVGEKLRVRVHEGRWIGLDVKLVKSKGVWVYWPDTEKGRRGAEHLLQRDIYRQDLVSRGGLLWIGI